ncbi:hypothetical protein Hanom_Chr03g00207871 [Helianthus anomalus]
MMARCSTLGPASSPLAPLFGEGYSTPFIPGWKIALSTIIDTVDVSRDFMSNAIPSAQRFINSTLDSRIFDDQYCLAVCEAFCQQCRHVGSHEGLGKGEGESDIPARSHRLGTRRSVGGRECEMLLACQGELEDYLKYFQTIASDASKDVEALRAEMTMNQDNNQKLASERHWLVSQWFARFLAHLIGTPEYHDSLGKPHQAYQDVGYQSGLKDGNAYSSSGLDMKQL